MYIMPAKKAHDLIAKEIFTDGEGALPLIASNHRRSVEFVLEHVKKPVPVEYLQDATCFILSELDINLNPEQLTEILQLFPSIRCRLAAYSANDTEVAEGLLDAVYAFFVGCRAPTFGDCLQHDRILKEYLHDRAKAAGYEVVLCQE